MRAKVTYYNDHQSAYISGTKLAVIAQVRLLLKKSFAFRPPAESLSSAIVTQFNQSDCWLVKV